MKCPVCEVPLTYMGRHDLVEEYAEHHHCADCRIDVWSYHDTIKH